jgi:hypothetical protein
MAHRFSLAGPAGVCVSRGSLAIGVTSYCAGGRARGVSCVIGQSEPSRVDDRRLLAGNPLADPQMPRRSAGAVTTYAHR